MRGIFLEDKLLKWKQFRMYVLVGKLHTKVLEEIHIVPMAGYQSEKTTHTELGKSFYWPNMKKDVEHYVCTCVKC